MGRGTASPAHFHFPFPCKDSEWYHTTVYFYFTLSGIMAEWKSRASQSIMPAKTPEIQIPEVTTAEATIESLEPSFPISLKNWMIV